MTNLNHDLDAFRDKVLNAEDLDKQKVLYNRMTRLLAKQDYSYFKLALLLFQQGKYKEAQQKMNKAIIFAPDKDSTYKDWLATLYYGRKLKDAITFGNKYYYKFGGTYPLENNLGMCYLHLEDYKTAIECFRMTIMENESSRLAYMNWALALYLQGEQFQARKKLNSWNTITAYEIGVYNKEITNLKEHLEKEINEEVQEKMKAKIDGFKFILQAMKEKQNALWE